MTITFQPSNYDSVHDDLLYTVYDAHAEDPGTYPNYKYIAQVYVNGDLIATLRKVPNPDTNIGIFNIGTVVRSYLMAVFAPTVAIHSFDMGENQFYIALQVQFGEEYDYTSYYDLEESDTIGVFNNYNKKPGENLLSEYADNIISNAPTTLKVYFDQNYSFLGYLATTLDPVPYTITTSTGGSDSGNITPTDAGVILNFSPAAINDAFTGLITAADSWYDVTIDEVTYRFLIVCEPKYDVYDIHFLNQFGAYDTKVFNKVSRKVLSIQKSSFGVLPYTVDSSGIVSYSNGAVRNESQHTYASQYSDKLILNSDILTDAEYEWLQDLIVSTQVFINIDGELVPCNISDNNYEPRKRVNDSLTNLVINVEFGRTLNAQYR